MLSGIDISHHQGTPNFDQVHAAGVQFVIAKATEGTGFIDDQFARNRAETHRIGAIFGAYHFADGGDPIAEANHFCAIVGALAVGEFPVLDWETRHPDPAAWCKAFCDQVKARTGVKPLVYLNQSTLAGYDWSPVVGGDYGLWLAKYDGAPGATPQAGRWPFCAMKQYTSSGHVPGIGGNVDMDAFYGDLGALLRYGKQGGAPAPAPVPAPAPKPAPAPAPAPRPAPAPAFNVAVWRANQGDTGAIFVRLQQWLNRMYPAYSHIGPVAPSYGPQTAAVLREFAHRSGIPSADGKNIGPKIAAALAHAGFRG